MKLPTALAGALPGAQAPDPAATRKATAQAWLRGEVADVTGGLIFRGDGGLVAVLQIEPANISLLSDRERGQRISALHEVLNGLGSAYQILAVPHPIDLDAYLRHLESLLQNTDPKRRHLLSQYLAYVRRVVGTGEAQERRFYLLLPLAAQDAKRRGAADDLRQRAAEVAAALGRADLHTVVLDDRALMDLLHAWLHPSTSAFERADLASPATIYVPGGDA